MVVKEKGDKNMSEKVLGFKEKEAYKYQGEFLWRYNVSNLVPVVSVEEIRTKIDNYIKEWKECPRKENCPIEVWEFSIQFVCNSLKELEKRLQAVEEKE